MKCPLKEAAKEAPGKSAFDQTTFQEFDALADKFAQILEASGVRAGDRIAFLHPPCVEAAALFFAAWRIGASICPLSLRIPPAQISSHLERLDARVYIDSFPIEPRLRATTSSLPTPSALIFTSGSTSLPKIAVLSLSNLLSNAEPAVQCLDLREDDRWLLNLPLYHVGGIGILLRCVLAKAAVVRDASDRSITHVSAVPTHLYRATPIYKNLRCLLIGGAPIPTYPERLPCYLTYGLTEMSSLVVGRLNPPKKECGSFDLGLPLPNREVRLSHDGEIQVRGAVRFQGYWDQGRILQPFDEEGWFSTGDLGRISEEGLAIFGRKDWQFISGGENIQPEEIENALLALPDVVEAAVLPIDDPEFGKRPAAILKTSDRWDAASLKTALLERLPKFKIPTHFIFVDELPKNSLKINRKALREIANKNI